MARIELPLDRSAAHAILCDVYPGFAKLTMAEGSRVITEFIQAWLATDATDMYAFGQRWATRRFGYYGPELVGNYVELSDLQAEHEGRRLAEGLRFL